MHRRFEESVVIHNGATATTDSTLNLPMAPSLLVRSFTIIPETQNQPEHLTSSVYGQTEWLDVGLALDLFRHGAVG
jgi:hypothetical protein